MVSLRQKYVIALATQRLARYANVNKSVISEARKSLPGLKGIPNLDVLAELTSGDPTLKLMRRAVDAKDYEGFAESIPASKPSGILLLSLTMYRDRHPNRNPSMPLTSSFGQTSQSSPFVKI